MSKAFVSYSSKDMRMASRLTKDLIINSPVSIFFAPWDISGGDSLIEKLENALVESDFFVPLLSPNFLASNHAKDELNNATALAMDKKINIIPVKIQECEIPPLLRHKIYIDFVNADYDIALDKLISSLSPKNSLKDLESLKAFLASDEHEKESMVILAKQVLNSDWANRDDEGKGVQLIGKKLEKGKNFKEALEVYNAAIERYPKQLSYYMTRSGINRRLKKFADADKDCDKILQFDDKNVRGLIQRFWIDNEWASAEGTTDVEKQIISQARACINQLQTVDSAKTTYLCGYRHVLAQGAVLCDDSAFADEATRLLDNVDGDSRIYTNQDRIAILKTLRILERFYRKQGNPNEAIALEDKRTKLEDEFKIYNIT